MTRRRTLRRLCGAAFAGCASEAPSDDEPRRRLHHRRRALLANQDIWIGQWGGTFFGGRGVPGRTDTPL